MAVVKYEVSERIAYIILSRPEKRNALNSAMVTELKDALRKAESDPQAKVIILKAEGESFCAGADLEYLQLLQKNSYEENLQDSSSLAELFSLIYQLKKVVIAQIQGHAIAGGCGLATVCDFSFAVPEANFGYTEVKIGFIPAIVSFFLLRKIGEGKAKELLLGGHLVPAEKARDYGLINFISTKDTLETGVKQFAQKLIKENSGQSLELTKQMINEIATMDLKEAMSYAAASNAKARSTEDCKRGINAFLNKEKISW